MLEHVQHQNQIEWNRWDVGLVELAAHDTVSPLIVLAIARGVCFNAAHVSELLELAQEKASAATNVEDSRGR
jgi:hypothetical protein